jgi:DNA-binding HxlR family transcriptional regulator
MGTEGNAVVGVRNCEIADALDVIGDRWSLVIIREVAYFSHRFNEIQEHTGAPRQMVTARLRKLEAGGVIERRPYSEKPHRDEYFLTKAGEDLMPALAALKVWGAQYAREKPSA